MPEGVLMSITITDLILESNKTARSKGWWDDPDRNVPELLALVHSEISEALEVYRNKGKNGLNETWDSETGKPEGFTIELADVLIRIADMCGELNLDLNDAIIRKMEYNGKRPYRHGNKKA